MYVATVIALLLILPLGSSVVQLSLRHDASAVAVLLRWFVFWGVGLRLGIAGIRQIAQPRFTARTILGLESDDVLFVVRELGFANSALGAIGIISIAIPTWTMPAAVAGALFYGMAGVNHVRHAPRTRNQTVAMVSDLLFALAVAALAVSAGMSA
jgi:hypothetical protein